MTLLFCLLGANIVYFSILREEGEQDLFEVPSRIWDSSDEDEDDMEEDHNDDMYL